MVLLISCFAGKRNRWVELGPTNASLVDLGTSVFQDELRVIPMK
jgi:hypothetical protein